MRGARERTVLVVAAVTMVGAWALPARAQIIDPGSTTTSTTEETTTTDLTLVPTTSTTDDDEVRTTTTIRRTTTTTVQAGPVVTLPPTTTTTELQESGPAPLPTTTSLPPPQHVDRGLSAGTIVSLVIAALLVLAAGLSIFTWRFWQATRPEPPTVAGHG